MGGIREAIFRAWAHKSSRCNYKGKLFEGGKWYCAIHAPSKVKEREQQKTERMFAKIERAKRAEEEYNERMKAKADLNKPAL